MTNIPSQTPSVLKIEFLFLDRETCGRCGGTAANLDAAVAQVGPVLAPLGVTLEVEKIHVTSETMARECGFVSSPTVRINGHDIQPQVRQSACDDCTDLGASGETVDCRVWAWRGEEFTEAPTELLVEAILQAAVHPADPAAESTPPDPATQANMARYFRGGGACCGGAETAAEKATGPVSWRACGC